MTPEIFVSYSREDEKQVFEVVDQLRAKGLKVWIDQQGIQGAKLWSQEIVTAIEKSKILVLFASKRAFASKNVAKEIALASESEKYILPVFMEEAPIPSSMKYHLAGIQHLVYTKGQVSATVDNILSALDNLSIDAGPKHRETASQNNSHQAPQSSEASRRNLLLAVAMVVIMAILSFVFFGKVAHEKPNVAENLSINILNPVLIVTNFEDSDSETVSDQNRELREMLINKLGRFRDYNITQGPPFSPDSSTKEYVELATQLDTRFILHAFVSNDKKTIRAKAFENQNKRFFWTTSFDEDDPSIDKETFLDDATSIISAQIAGYDGAIHRWTVENAKETPTEELNYLQLIALTKRIWEMQGDPEAETQQSLDYIRRAIKLNPKSSSAHAIQGQLYGNAYTMKLTSVTNGLELAKQSTSRAIQLDPQNGIAHLARLWISMHAKDFLLSRQLVKDSKEINPYEPFLLATIGFYHLNGDQTNPKLGKDYLEKAILYNGKPQLWYYFALEEYYVSNDQFQEALSLSLKGPESSVSTCIYYWILGDKETALKKFAEFVAIKPSSTRFLEHEEENKSETLYSSKHPKVLAAQKELFQAYKNSVKQ